MAAPGSINKKKYKTRNFDIVNYIHLTYAGAEYDKGIQRSSAGMAALSIARHASLLKRLKQDFKETTGMEIHEFIEAAKKQEVVLTKMINLFETSDFKTLKHITTKDLQKDLELTENAAKNLKIALKTQGEIAVLHEMLYPSYQNEKKYKEEKDNWKEVEQFFKKHSGDVYKNILTFLDETNKRGFSKETSARTGQLHESNRMKTVEIMLIKRIFDSVKYLRSAESGTNKIFFHGFTWSDFDDIQNTLNAIDDGIQSFYNQGSYPKVGELDKLIRSIEQGIQTTIKGKNIGEFTSGVLMASPIFRQIVETSTLNALKAPEHTAVDNKPQEQIYFSLHSQKKGISHHVHRDKTLEKQLNEIVNRIVAQKDMKADITIKTQAGKNNIGISTKRKLPKSTYIDLASETTVAKALSFGPHGKDIINTYTQNKNMAQLFYNAMHFYMADSDFDSILERDSQGEPVIYNVIEKPLNKSLIEIQATFGNILTQFALDVIANVLIPTSTAFIDINGRFLPTPLYFEWILSAFANNAVMNATSNYVSFNRSKYSKKIKDIIVNKPETQVVPVTKKRADGSKKTGYGNTMGVEQASMYRNIKTKEAIMDHEISVRAPYLSASEYRRIVFGIK